MPFTLPESAAVLVLRAMRANRIFVSPDAARARIRERSLRPLPYGPPSNLRADVSTEVEHRRGWPLYTVTPVGGAPRGTVVYVHGGGWVNEIAVQHWRLVADIAIRTGATVLVPIYPLIPFGTAGEVVAEVAELVRETLPHGPVALAGDSAGGQIALSTALRLRDTDAVVLPATVLLSPALDLTWSNPRIPEVQPSDPWLAVPGGRVLAEEWRGDLDLRDPQVSPLAGDLHGLGPVTVLTGTRDVLNPDAHLLVEKLRAAQVPVDLHEAVGSVHVYALLPTPNGHAGRATILATLAAALGS
ncbi:alpha/beta hydrolase fold domain-containing protein [Pseudolysinimonas sp.]|jgi:acetyl esterase/lipase|uniref:alpha/beta hydrolase fold domain-containing protein n=1 Tax=Pseudolysinimonas sp. TaxID=2680009 RepID=UPI00378474A9